jgi:MFS transporter, ACS family, glucarate transporter
MTGDKGSWARGNVLLLICALGLVLYLDRVVMGQALVPIQNEFKLSDSQMGLVAMAFTIAYGLFEIPTGHWGDRIGARRVLTRIVLWWSAFTVLTAGAWNLWSLILVRFAFGAGEAGAYPNAARVIKRWFPPTERGRVQGLLAGSSQIGAVLSPLLAQVIIRELGWRWAFILFGLVGAVWVAIFWRWFRDDPSDHPDVSPQELATIRAGVVEIEPALATDHAFPWHKLARPNPWLLGFIIATASFVAYLYNTWYSKYLQAARGFSGDEASYAFALIQGTSAAGIFVGGWIGDVINRTGDRAIGLRRKLGFCALSTAAAIQFVAHWSEVAWLCIGLVSFSLFILYLHHASWWSTVTDTGGRHTGTLFGFANGLGVVGGVSAQYFFGWFSDYRKAQGFSGRDQYDPAFMVYAVVLFCGACAWLLMQDRKENDEGPATPTANPDATPPK